MSPHRSKKGAKKKPYRKTFKSHPATEIWKYLEISKNTTVVFSKISPTQVDSEGFIIQRQNNCFVFTARNPKADIPFAFLKIKPKYLKQVTQELELALRNLEKGQFILVNPYGYGIDFILVAVKQHRAAHIRGTFPKGKHYHGLRRALDEHEIWCQISFGEGEFRINSLPWVTEVVC